LPADEWDGLNRLTGPVKGGISVGKSSTVPNRLTREYHYEGKASKGHHFPPNRRDAAIAEVKIPI
jgi:hypothetical protein